MDVKLSEKQATTLWSRVDRALRYAEKEWHPKCKRAADLYSGQHWPDMERASDQSRVVVNYLWPAVETKVANVTFAYPDFRLKPLNDIGQQNSTVAEHVLRYDWRIMGAQREARRARRDREIFGLGVVYTGWLYETEPVGAEEGQRVEGGRPADAVEAEDTTPDTNPLLNMETEEGAPPPLPGDPFSEPVAPPRTDRPFVKRISPRCFFIDLEADSVLENASFCGYVEYRPLDDVKRDKRLSNTKKLEGNAKGNKPWLDEEARSKGDEEMPADVKRVKLMHYFERATKLHVIYCDEHKKPLLIEKWRHEGDWYPFVVDRVADEEDCFYPIPPLLRVEHQAMEIDHSRSIHAEWCRKSLPKYQVVQGTLTEEQRQAITSDVAGTVAENLQAPVTAMPMNPLSREVLEAYQFAVQDLQFIAGLNDYETSSAPSKRMTSAEVEAVRSSGGSRGAADRQAFEAFCSEIAQQVLALEQQYSVRSRQLPIFDQNENVSGFIDLTPEQIEGRYLVEVYVGSTTAPNPQETLQGIAFAMQSLAPLLQVIPVAQQFGIDLKSLIPKLLKAALPEIRDIDSLLQPQVPPGMPMGVSPTGGVAGVDPAGLPPEAQGMPAPMGAQPAAPADPTQMLAALLAGQGA